MSRKENHIMPKADDAVLKYYVDAYPFDGDFNNLSKEEIYNLLAFDSRTYMKYIDSNLIDKDMWIAAITSGPSIVLDYELSSEISDDLITYAISLKPSLILDLKIVTKANYILALGRAPKLITKIKNVEPYMVRIVAGINPNHLIYINDKFITEDVLDIVIGTACKPGYLQYVKPATMLKLIDKCCYDSTDSDYRQSLINKYGNMMLRVNLNYIKELSSSINKFDDDIKDAILNCNNIKYMSFAKCLK